MPQSLADVLIHLVFSTKNRVRFLKSPDVREHLNAYMERPFDWNVYRRAGESHPVGVPVFALPGNPGLRCAAPWAIESGPFGAGGLRPHTARRQDAGRAVAALRTCTEHAGFGRRNRPYNDNTNVRRGEPIVPPDTSTEGAAFDSPGCNPGYPSQPPKVALKGRDSPGAPCEFAPRHGEYGLWAIAFVGTIGAHLGAFRQWFPAGANPPTVRYNANLDRTPHCP